MNIEQIVYNYSKSQGVSDNVAKIITAQSKLESGNYSSNLFKTSNNLFGYKYVGQSIATSGIAAPSSEGNLRYANYSRVEDSVLEIIKWINRRVAEKKFTLQDLETPEGYARALKNAGYYGDSYENYSRNLRRLYNSLQLGNQQQTTQPPPPQPTPAAVAAEPATNVIPAPSNKIKYKPSILNLNNYSKDYVVLTSDRLILNSKEDSIFLVSKKTIGLSAVEQIHFNIGPIGEKDPTKHYMVVNSPAIQLGLEKDGKNEPVAKADSTIAFINDLIDVLQNLATSLQGATGAGAGSITLASVNVAGNKLLGGIKALKDRYTGNASPIKSKITKTI